MSKGFLRIPFSILLYLFSFLGFAHSLYRVERWQLVLGNADLLYSYDFLLFLYEGGQLSNWTFPPAIYLIPDLFISFIAFFLLKLLEVCFSWTFRTDIHFIFTIFIHQILLVWMLIKIFEQNIQKKKINRFNEVLLSKMFLVFAILNIINLITDRFLDLTLLTNHSGSLLLFCVIYYCFLRNYWSIGLICNFLAAISDSFVPSVLIVFYFFAVFQYPLKRKLIIAFTSMSVLGILFIHCLQWIGWIHLGQQYYLKFLSDIDYAKFWDSISIDSLTSSDSRWLRTIMLWKYQFFQNIGWNIFIFFCYLYSYSLQKKRTNSSIGIRLTKFGLEKYRIQNSSILLDFKMIGIINLCVALIYSCFSLFLPLRYLPIFTFLPFILLLNVFRWKILSILWFGLLFYSVFINYLLSSKEYVDFKKPIKSQTILEETIDFYPDYKITANYWQARPLRFYSAKINQLGITAIRKDGTVLNWIDRIREDKRYVLDLKVIDSISAIENESFLRAQWIVLIQE
ncbi:hypothetical protein [Leptospira sp. GIMC2001]|uniref:hypothetical protein n=1 Tax=Leptospira sp. GIMC2001 TaxID=1513297 RepID=UPI00234BE6F0|nr:hypothetical protein [Leptospira sp. GIMC2001]WCL49027.1 hypothetical protein O4O04_17310 [Leptospira sp. GIMC2001]